MRKHKLFGRIYGMKCSWKGHKNKNRHKNRIKRSVRVQMVDVFYINHNILATWGLAHGDKAFKASSSSSSSIVLLLYFICACPRHLLFSYWKADLGSLTCATILVRAVRAHEGETGTDGSAQVLDRKNNNWKTVLYPVSTGSQNHGSCFQLIISAAR